MDLIDLNDEILLNVCENLNVFDLGAMAGTCKHLAALAATVAGRRYRCLDYKSFMLAHSDIPVDNSRTPSIFAATMRFVGPHVERMHFNDNPLRKYKFGGLPSGLRNWEMTDQSLWPLVARYFHRLRLVDVAVQNNDAKELYDWRTVPLQSDGQQLVHELWLYGNDVDDTQLGFIIQHWRVDELYIRGQETSPDDQKNTVSGISGRALSELRGVRRLQLHDCHSMQAQHFQQFLINNADSLRYLVVKSCTQLCDWCEFDLPTPMKLIEMQEMRGTDWKTLGRTMHWMTDLSELRVLELNYGNQLVKDLAAIDRLEELHVFNVNFTAPPMYESGRFFTHLREVSLDWSELDSMALVRFASERLEEIQFKYKPEIVTGVVELVRKSRALRLLSMFGSTVIQVKTLKRIAEGRSNVGEAMKRLRLQLSHKLVDNVLLGAKKQYEHMIELVIDTKQ